MHSIFGSNLNFIDKSYYKNNIQKLYLSLNSSKYWHPIKQPENKTDILEILENVANRMQVLLDQIKISSTINLDQTIIEISELYLLYHGFKEFCFDYKPEHLMSEVEFNQVLTTSTAIYLRSLIMSSVSLVEYCSSLLIAKEVANLNNTNQAHQHLINTILYLSGLSSSKPDTIVSKEILIQIVEELLVAKINKSSSVLIAGCGPLPLTAVAYALHCEKVHLVDICSKNLTNAKLFVSLLPNWISSKCNFICEDATNLDYNSLQVSHLVLTGMLPVKKQILTKLKSNYNRNSLLCCIIREPKKNLMMLFNYPLGSYDLNDSTKRYVTKHRSWSDVIITNLPNLI